MEKQRPQKVNTNCVPAIRLGAPFLFLCAIAPLLELEDRIKYRVLFALT